MGTGNWGPSKCGNLLPLFLLLTSMSETKELNIYIDESGDYSPYSESNPLYSVAFVLVEDECRNRHAIETFNNQILIYDGGDHFVHTGNLVRAEKPYREMLRESRQKLFYSLFLLSKFAKYKVCCANVLKKGKDDRLVDYISNSIYDMIIRHDGYFTKFSKIILHYDNGQSLLGGIIISTFKMRYSNVIFKKTLQQDSKYMQIADLFSYFELIKHKIAFNNLTKSEVAFFGTSRKIRNNYLKQLEDKYL